MSALDSLAAEPRWVAWLNECRGDKGKPTKVPYQPVPDGGRAKASDPSTWGTREAAERRLEDLDVALGGGMGIVLGDLGGDTYLGGIDLDSCLDQTQTCAAWAEAVLAAAATYGEVSPS